MCGLLSLGFQALSLEASESETEMTVEISLPMTAGQSHNWLVDVSLSISDVSIGAELWSVHRYIYYSAETQTVCSQQFFTWQNLQLIVFGTGTVTVTEGLITRLTAAVIGSKCFLDCAKPHSELTLCWSTYILNDENSRTKLIHLSLADHKLHCCHFSKHYTL